MGLHTDLSKCVWCNLRDFLYVTSCICHGLGNLHCEQLSTRDVFDDYITHDRYRESRYSPHTSDAQYVYVRYYSLSIMYSWYWSGSHIRTYRKALSKVDNRVFKVTTTGRVVTLATCSINIYNNLEELINGNSSPVLWPYTAMAVRVLKSRRYSLLHLLHFSTLLFPWSSYNPVGRGDQLLDNCCVYWDSLEVGNPLLLCRPSQFWLTTACRIPFSMSCTNDMCVGVGIALVTDVVLCFLMSRPMPLARSSHAPGPAWRNTRASINATA